MKNYLLFLLLSLGFLSCNHLGRDNYQNRDKFEVVAPVTEQPPVAYGVEDGEVVHNTEAYNLIVENDFFAALEKPLSTFGIDVDNAAYSNTRRFLNSGALPPVDAVRIEELINYFDYTYDEPAGPHPFNVITEVADCPWNEAHRLVHIGLKGKEVQKEVMPNSNLVFLIDVSGSMDAPNKLPLLKGALTQLIKNIRDEDRIAMVVYAGSSGVVLESTPGANRRLMVAALGELQAGGSTAGAAGIELAYEIAEKNFVADGNNRVILATDGDFNVGISSQSELVRLIEKKREKGVFLSVLGFGTGNYKDAAMEQLANNGNGNYFYIDNIREAKKVLVEEMTNTLYTIAKDVKLQVEFNPAQVKEYRLIGYENRVLRNEDFNNDVKDAGDLGAGHTVTALYEIVPVGSASTLASEVDPLKYQDRQLKNSASEDPDVLTLKLRYKQPDSNTSQLLEVTARDNNYSLSDASENFHFSAAVAGFGMLLRESKHKGSTTYDLVEELAIKGKGKDERGYRQEFIDMIHIARGYQELEAYEAER